MAKQMQGRGRSRAAEAAVPALAASGVPTTPEPPVRRWPHPVDGVEPVQQTDPALHFIPGTRTVRRPWTVAKRWPVRTSWARR